MIYFVLFCLLFFLFCCSYSDFREEIRKGQAAYDRERLREEEELRKEAGVNEDSEGSYEQY